MNEILYNFTLTNSKNFCPKYSLLRINHLNVEHENNGRIKNGFFFWFG